MAGRFAAVRGVVALAGGCIDQARVNDTCKWSDSVTRRLDLARSADREHLRQDAEVANELMVRIGDAHVRHRPDLQRPYRDACIAALVDSVMTRHAVTRAQIHAAERARVWWADVLAVFVPIGLLAAFAMDAIVRRVCRAFEADDRAIATVSVAVLIPVVAGLALAVANFWAFAVEGWRLGDGHVSNRAS